MKSDAKSDGIQMQNEEFSLVESAKPQVGQYGGFSFGGVHPVGVTAHRPLPHGTVFPNGAKAALLMTFDVEGNYGNGIGDLAREIENYQRICTALAENGVPATFNVVGKMAQEHGPDFVNWMLDADCEVAPHGYVHDMNKRYGGDRVYAGHYGPKENAEQVRDGIDAINAVRPGIVRGIRLPYGHFNEYSYDAIADAGLAWSSNLGIDDFLTPGQGFGPAPFQMKIGGKLYPIVEIPLDSQTYDWCVWIADEQANSAFVQAVRTYCQKHHIEFERTPAGAVAVWQQRMTDAIETETTFTLLCHPTNLAVSSDRWGDPVDEFLLPVIDQLGQLHRTGQAWVCTCNQLTDFYWQTMKAHNY